MPSTISPATSLAELVVDRPSRSRVFERFGLDYCCGGNRSLEEVCRERGIDLPAVLDALTAAAAPATRVDWAAASIGDLVDHIVGVHHAGLRDELPRLSQLLDAVVRAHGGGHPELAEVRSVFEELRAELETHIAEEEQHVFPACRSLPDGAADFSLAPISVLVAEHAEAGRLLGRLAELTGDFAVERALCGTHRAAVDGLRELTQRTFEHVHLENNVLFPRVLELVDGS